MANDTITSACRNGDLAYVKEHWSEFCDQVEDFEAQSENLLIAAGRQRGHAEVVSFLLEHNAHWNKLTLWIIARTGAKYAENCPIFSLFLERGWDPNTSPDNVGTVLVQAIRKSNKPLIRLLLANGADPNLEYDRDNALHRARHRRRGTQAGMTPLDAAAASSTPEVFQILLDHGARLEDANPLHKAASVRGEGRLVMVDFLLGKGLDINALETYPETSAVITCGTLGTPLHYAVRWENAEMVKHLLKRGANPKAESTKELGTPLDWLTDMSIKKPEQFSAEILNLLEQKPAVDDSA